LGNFIKPTYNLDTLQSLIKRHDYLITMSASNGAISMGMNDADIVTAVMQLKADNFYKTMQSEKIPTLWQDVYHLEFKGKTLYIKLQITANAVIISFKEK